MRLADVLLVPCIAVAAALPAGTAAPTPSGLPGKVICFDETVGPFTLPNGETVGPITPPEVCVPDPRPGAPA